MEYVPRESDARETLRRRELIAHPRPAQLRPRPSLLYGGHASKRAERANDMPPANRSANASGFDESADRGRLTNYVRPENSRRESTRTLTKPPASADIDRSTRQFLADRERASGLHRDENHRDGRLPQSRECPAGDPRASLGQRLPTKDSTIHAGPSQNHDRHGQSGPEPLVAAPVKARRAMKNPEVAGPSVGQDVARRVDVGPVAPLRAPRSKNKHVVPAERFLAETMTAVNFGARPTGRTEKQPVRVEVREVEWRRQTDARAHPTNPRARPARKQKRERRPLAHRETDRNGEVFAPASAPAVERRLRRERRRPERRVGENLVDVAEPQLAAAAAGKRPRDRTIRRAPRRPAWNLDTRPLGHRDDRRALADTSGGQAALRARHGVEQPRFVV